METAIAGPSPVSPRPGGPAVRPLSAAHPACAPPPPHGSAPCLRRLSHARASCARAVASREQGRGRYPSSGIRPPVRRMPRPLLARKPCKDTVCTERRTRFTRKPPLLLLRIPLLPCLLLPPAPSPCPSPCPSELPVRLPPPLPQARRVHELDTWRLGSRAPSPSRA